MTRLLRLLLLLLLALALALALYELRASWAHVKHRLFGRGSRSAVPSPALQLEEIGRLVEVVKPDVLVDVGCGTGNVLAHVSSSRPAVRLVGIERDEETAQLARARVPGARVLTSDMLDVGPQPAVVAVVCYVMYEPLFEMPGEEAARIYSAFLDRVAVAAPTGQRVHVIYASRTGFTAPRAFMASEAEFLRRGFELRSRRTNGSILFRREVRHYERAAATLVAQKNSSDERRQTADPDHRHISN